jgi:hypothetical protein
VAVVIILNSITIGYSLKDLGAVLETSTMIITGICVPFIYKALRKIIGR